MKKRKIIITADDFGLSPGVNRAIIELYKKQAVSRASLFANCSYTGDAVALMRDEAPHLPLGIHLSLTCGQCSAEPAQVPLLADKDGYFKLNYLELIISTILPFRKARMLRQIKTEFNAQINRLLQMDVHINHIDGHRHVHMIPGIFSLTCELMEQYNINDIRIINETICSTLKMVKRRSVSIPGLIKYIILKFFSRVNNYKITRYFFSILYSCNIDPELMNYQMMDRLPEKYSEIEIMLHPGNPEIDRIYQSNVAQTEIQQILDPMRELEFLTAVAIKDYIA